MTERGFWKLEAIADTELERGLRELVAHGRQTDARVVAHLAEVETRRLHLKSGAESLFAYCQKRLNLSENQAFYRIVAARTARQFPCVFELLDRGDIHLTSLALLSKYLTEENHRELLSKAHRKTKRELLELLASVAPRPDVQSTIRKLPTRVTGSQQAFGAQRTAPGRSAPRPELSPAVTSSSSIAVTLASSRAVAAGRTGSLEPLSPTAYRLQLNTTPQLKEKLELARDLMSHANPSGDLAVVVERALDLLVAELNKQRFGQLRPRSRPKGAKPRTSQALPCATAEAREEAQAAAKTRRSAVRADAQPDVDGAGDLQEAETPSLSMPRRRRQIHNDIRRQLIARDGLCCTFRSEDGQHCTTRAFLQIHHEHAWAKGGPDTLDNLRLLCASHNRVLAELEFGKRRAS
jgi:HNH endonuclease